MTIRSTLAPYAASMRDPDPAAARRAARDAYHSAGLVLINPDWLAGWADRQQLKILADKVHGPPPTGDLSSDERRAVGDRLVDLVRRLEAAQGEMATSPNGASGVSVEQEKNVA